MSTHIIYVFMEKQEKYQPFLFEKSILTEAMNFGNHSILELSTKKKKSRCIKFHSPACICKKILGRASEIFWNIFSFSSFLASKWKI